MKDFTSDRQPKVIPAHGQCEQHVPCKKRSNGKGEVAIKSVSVIHPFINDSTLLGFLPFYCWLYRLVLFFKRKAVKLLTFEGEKRSAVRFAEKVIYLYIGKMKTYFVFSQPKWPLGLCAR